MNYGDQIKLTAFGGEEITRRVIVAENGTVYVCKEAEYQSAIRENREPVCVGFPMESIIEEVNE